MCLCTLGRSGKRSTDRADSIERSPTKRFGFTPEFLDSATDPDAAAPVKILRTLARAAPETRLGRALRWPLALIPPNTTVRILGGRLKGKKWIVGRGVHGYWLGTYEETIQAAVSQAVRPGGVFFDVGANVGYYTLLASVLVGPSGRVVAFEPDPRNVSRLREHVRLNGADNVTIVDVAVADASGSERFAGDRGGLGGALAESGGERVRTVTLDDAVAGGLPAPGYVKIDVEGAEFRVLSGARRLLERPAPAIFLAVHGTDVERRCRELLAACGYRMRPIEHDAWLCEPATFGTPPRSGPSPAAPGSPAPSAGPPSPEES
jgi:FkbM family methyltransferase